jgi:hypothetical protein
MRVCGEAACDCSVRQRLRITEALGIVIVAAEKEIEAEERAW